MRCKFAAIGVLLLAVVGCQPSAVGVSPTSETPATVAATTSVWGEVPKQCA